MRLRRLAFVAVLAASIASAGGAHAADQTPSELVTDFHETLLGVMKDAKTLGVKGRFKRLQPKIEEAFHLALMIQVAAGSHWRDATPEQTEKLVEAFGRLSASTYASQFDGFSGQSFKTDGAQPGPQKTTLVKTRIIKSVSGSVDLVYVTRLIKGEWRIIDVVVDSGISELAVKRSEYGGILRSGGIDGLIATLNNKADQLLAE